MELRRLKRIYLGSMLKNPELKKKISIGEEVKKLLLKFSSAVLLLFSDKLKVISEKLKTKRIPASIFRHSDSS